MCFETDGFSLQPSKFSSDFVEMGGVFRERQTDSCLVTEGVVVLLWECVEWEAGDQSGE